MRVRKTEVMDPELFSKHINHRHASDGELADLAEVAERSVRSPKDRAVWEAYHERLHQTREYDHEH
jgi:hypothetical protein